MQKSTPRIVSAGRIWVLALIASGIVAAVAFKFLDVPLARVLLKVFGELNDLGHHLSSTLILTGEGLTVIALSVARLARGQLPPVGKALAIACLVSICTYAINDGVLKIFFGVPDPLAVVYHSVPHHLNLLDGGPGSSFPSGHMALAAAFAGVFMPLYRQSLWPLITLLTFGAVLLIGGGWHFVSDVIAGGFFGLTAGLLAGETWRVHLARIGAASA